MHTPSYSPGGLSTAPRGVIEEHGAVSKAGLVTARPAIRRVLQQNQTA